MMMMFDDRVDGNDDVRGRSAECRDCRRIVAMLCAFIYTHSTFAGSVAQHVSAAFVHVHYTTMPAVCGPLKSTRNNDGANERVRV